MVWYMGSIRALKCVIHKRTTTYKVLCIPLRYFLSSVWPARLRGRIVILIFFKDATEDVPSRMGIGLNIHSYPASEECRWILHRSPRLLFLASNYHNEHEVMSINFLLFIILKIYYKFYSIRLIIFDFASGTCSFLRRKVSMHNWNFIFRCWTYEKIKSHSLKADNSATNEAFWKKGSSNYWWRSNVFGKLSFTLRISRCPERYRDLLRTTRMAGIYQSFSEFLENLYILERGQGFVGTYLFSYIDFLFS